MLRPISPPAHSRTDVRWPDWRFRRCPFVDGDDAVDGSIQNGLDARLALPQCLLRLLARSDVTDDAGEIAIPFPGTSLRANSIGKM